MPRAFVTIGLVAVVLGSSTSVRGDDAKSAEAVLKEKGLRRLGTAYVVAGEAEVQKRLNEARAAYREMVAGQNQRQMIDYQARENKGLIRELTEQRLVVNQQLAQPLPAAERSQFVAMANGLTDRLNLLVRQERDAADKGQLDAAIARRREAYIQGVLDLRGLVDAANESYKGFAEDTAVMGALDTLNASTKVKLTLGPSKAFLANVKLLEGAEKSVLTENVPLRREGGIYWVDVTFNGKVTKSMAFDTGASTVLLPAGFAAEVGVRPGPDAPVVKCQVADGSVVEARAATIPVMRVGQFTVRDVPCVVMPETKKDVPPLLGQTFQRNFTLKFSPDAGKLTLTRVDAPEPAAAKPASKRAAGKGAAGKR
jgi:clan AA aspartic protease (TIGR02281 family)